MQSPGPAPAPCQMEGDAALESCLLPSPSRRRKRPPPSSRHAERGRTHTNPRARAHTHSARRVPGQGLLAGSVWCVRLALPRCAAENCQNCSGQAGEFQYKARNSLRADAHTGRASTGIGRNSNTRLFIKFLSRGGRSSPSVHNIDLPERLILSHRGYDELRSLVESTDGEMVLFSNTGDANC